MPTDWTYSNTPSTAVPLPSFAPSNTAPVAVPLAGFTPSNTAPAAVPLAGFTPSNAAPVAVPLSGFTPSNAAPSAVALPSFTPSNTAPVAVPLAGFTPSNTAPGAVPLPSFTPSNAAPVAVPLADMTPSNTAPVAVPLAGFAPSNAAPGAVPLPSYTATNDTPRPIGYTPPLTPLKDDNVNSPILKIEGALALNSTYGQTRIPTASALERVQLALESAPLTGPATITLVDAAGVSYGVSVTVLAGETFGETIPGAPVALPAGSNIRAKCTATPGGNDPGAYGVVTLFTRLAA